MKIKFAQYLLGDSMLNSEQINFKKFDRKKRFIFFIKSLNKSFIFTYYTKMVFDLKVWNVSPKFHGYAHTGYQIGLKI